MKDIGDPKGSCEFHFEHNEKQTKFVMHIISSCPMNTPLTLLALQMFVDEIHKANVDLYNQGDDFILVEN